MRCLSLHGEPFLYKLALVPQRCIRLPTFGTTMFSDRVADFVYYYWNLWLTSNLLCRDAEAHHQTSMNVFRAESCEYLDH